LRTRLQWVEMLNASSFMPDKMQSSQRSEPLFPFTWKPSRQVDVNRPLPGFGRMCTRRKTRVPWLRITRNPNQGADQSSTSSNVTVSLSKMSRHPPGP